MTVLDDVTVTVGRAVTTVFVGYDRVAMELADSVAYEAEGKGVDVNVP
jgi:hypothetical protein